METTIDDLESLYDQLDAYANTIRNRDKHIAELEARADGWRKDAERYRWLRDSNNFVDGGMVVGNAEGEEILWDTSLDAAIDAALAQQEKP